MVGVGSGRGEGEGEGTQISIKEFPSRLLSCEQLLSTTTNFVNYQKKKKCRFTTQEFCKMEQHKKTNDSSTKPCIL